MRSNRWSISPKNLVQIALLVLLVVFFIYFAISILPSKSTSQETIISLRQQTDTPFTGHIVFKFNYDEIPKDWANTLPEKVEVEVAFKPESGWDDLKVYDAFDYEGITLYKLVAYYPRYPNLEGCEWQSIVNADEWGHPIRTLRLWNCRSFKNKPIIYVPVTMAYCKESIDQSITCRYEGLWVNVDCGKVSYRINGEAKTVYLELLRELLEYKGLTMPTDVMPNHKYISAGKTCIP